MRLTERVVVVTGGGRGIGRAIALAAATEGADVTLADLDTEPATAVAAEIAALDRDALVVRTDVTRPTDATEMVRQTIERFGRIDVLVNCAGISGTRPFLEIEEAEWDRVLDTNLKGVFLCCQAAGREMVRQKRGAIVNIASIAAEGGFPMRASYCASKAGVVALTRVLASEWAEHGIRVNAVGPGYTNTELVQRVRERGLIPDEAIVGRTPMRRFATPEEIADAVIFLASDAAQFITGHTLYVDGGWMAHRAW